jgi:hypothetical protein
MVVTGRFAFRDDERSPVETLLDWITDRDIADTLNQNVALCVDTAHG